MMLRNPKVSIDWLDPPMSAVGFHANGMCVAQTLT